MLTMPRKKTKTLTSMRINSQLLDRLDRIADRVGRTRSDVIDRALEEYVTRQEAEHAELTRPKITPRK